MQWKKGNFQDQLLAEHLVYNIQKVSYNNASYLKEEYLYTK